MNVRDFVVRDFDVDPLLPSLFACFRCFSMSFAFVATFSCSHFFRVMRFLLQKHINSRVGDGGVACGPCRGTGLVYSLPSDLARHLDLLVVRRHRDVSVFPPEERTTRLRVSHTRQFRFLHQFLSENSVN